MKRFLILLLTLTIALPSFAKSKVEEISIQSKILGIERKCNVYLPDGYNDEKKYPVLYLLHGLGGDYKTWNSKYGLRDQADMKIKSGFAVPMVIVMPDASGVDGDPRGKWVGYNTREGYDYESFFFDELIPEIEKRYSVYTDARHRAVSGLSMGGHGTVLFALARPEYFSSACPLSGRIEGVPPTSRRTKEYIDIISSNDFVKNWDKKYSEETRQKAAQIRWYFDCGDGDNLLDGSYDLFNLLKKQGAECCELRVRDGIHSKWYWIDSIRDVLTFISIGFSLE